MGDPTPPAAAAEVGSLPHRRLFVGLALPPVIQAQLALCVRPLPGARWVAPAQLHLTLRFLGPVAAGALPGLTAALAGVRAAPFDLAVAGVGQFPQGARHPRVLWAGVTPHAPVQALKRAIDRVLGPDPEEGERGFSPHVTLARLKDDPALPPALAAFREDHQDLGSAPFPVRSFVLFESRTRPGGAEYAVVNEQPLVAP